MKKNMTMLILSCDKFSDLWDGQIKLLDENWHDRDIETVIVTDAPTDKSYPGVRILSVTDAQEWSDRLASAVKQVKTDYVFVTLDDYYLIDKVSDAGIIALMEMMEKEHFDYVRLFPRPKSATMDELENYPGVFRVNTERDYSVNLYSGIWKKDFLASTVKTPKNAWQFEVSLKLRAQEYGAKCAVSNRGDYKILDVVRKGKLLRKSARYFRRHPGVYNGDRETNSLGYELRLGVQTQLSRHLPRRVFYKLKDFLTRRGMRFYSDYAD